MTEVEIKLRLTREIMVANGLSAVRLKGSDWFAWATGGGSSAVVLTAEAGAGEVFITPKGAWVLTDTIDRARFRDEEAPKEFELWSRPWEAPRQTDAFVREHTKGGRVASDRPVIGEMPIPADLLAAKRRLLPDELDRYRALGVHAAQAATEVLLRARPEWTGLELAAETARALWSRGIIPTIALAAGETRIAKYRHPTPSPEKLGSRAMVTLCGRRHGLHASLTRFVYFREPTPEEKREVDAVAQVEAVAFAHSAPGTRLSQIYHALPATYQRLGHGGEYLKHHQGGLTGYLPREALATTTTDLRIEDGAALAWNPSLPGATIEDTVVSTSKGIEILTADPEWPTFYVEGRNRPDILVRP